MKLPCKTSGMLPHEADMFLIRELQSCDASGASAFYRSCGGIFSNGHCSDPLIFIELFAQLAAVFSSFNSTSRMSRKGFLSGISDLCVSRLLKEGETASVSIRKTEEFAGFSFFESAAHCGDQLLVSGIIKVWRSEDAFSVSNTDTPLESRFLSTSGNVSAIDAGIEKAIVSVKELSAGKLEILSSFDKDFCGFSGHFRNNPVLPGVVLLRIPILVLSQKLGITLRLFKLSSAKFSMAFVPAETIRVLADFTQGGIFTVNVKVYGSEKRPSASFEMILEREI